MTFDSEILPSTQTSVESKVSFIHQLEDQEEQNEVFQSNDEHSDNDNIMRKFEGHRSARDFDNRENSMKIYNVKSFSQGKNVIFILFLDYIYTHTICL